MKTILTVLLLALGLLLAAPLAPIGCKVAPSERVVAVQSLKMTGATAEAAVALSAQLFRDQKITAAQAREVMNVYDTKFQPAFRLAVAAAKSDLSTLASPDLAALAGQLLTLVANLQKATP